MITGKVARVLDDQTLVATFGEVDGVTQDMKFQVYENTGVIRDPDTNEVLSQGESIVKANLEVDEIKERVSILKTTKYTHSLPFSEIASIGASLNTGFTTTSQRRMETDDGTPESIMTVRRGNSIREIEKEEDTNDEPLAQEQELSEE